MVSMATRVPTDLEAAYLANLGNSVSLPPVNPFVIQTQLYDILRLCRIPWVADFLFSSEMTSLAALTAPLNMRSAITCTAHLTHIQCQAPFNDRPFDLNLHGSYIFVPAFSVAPISVGFGVHECITNCFVDQWLSPTTNVDLAKANHFRFVRDDKNGILLMSYRDSRTGCFKIESISQVSASSRRRVVAVFNHDAIHKAAHSEHGILPLNAVLAALNFIHFVTETHDCSLCGPTAASPCKCKLDITPPVHPLDFSSLARNMSSYLGSWEGLACNAVVDNAKELLSSSVGVRMQIIGGNDQDLLNRLSRWAISDQIASRKENIFAFVMPNEGVQTDTTDVNNRHLDLFPTSLWLGDGDCEPLEIPSLLLDGDLNASSCSSGSGGMRIDGGAQRTQTSTIVDQLKDVNTLQAGIAKGSAPENRTRGGNITGEISWTANTDEALALVNRITEVLDKGDLCDVDAPDGSSLDSLSGNAETKMGDTTLKLDDAGQVRLSKTLSIAPAAVKNTPMAVQEQDEKELRAQRRKQRNREAAQRSNARRKQKNDSLKKALKESHEKAVQLRARELSLREENLQLRKLTSS